MSFNFGNTTTPGLGTTSTPAKPAGFGNFSFSTPATSAPPAFGTASFGTASAAVPAFGGFGTAATSTAAPSFGFGQTTTTSSAAPSFNFGGAAAPSFGFGQTATTSAPSFGFGQTATSSAPSFGFGQVATSFAAPAFGAPSAFGGAFGQPQQQQQQQQMQLAPSADDIFQQSIFNVNVFGDERDATLAKWNYLQALLGTGKAFYSQSQPPVEISPQNYLCRFKAMGYSRLPGKDNKLGMVALRVNKSIGQVKEQQQQLVGTLNQVFGNKPTLVISVDSVKALSDAKSQVVIYVDEKSPNSNETKRFTATEIAGYLNQQNIKNQLTSQGIEEVQAMIPPDEDQLKKYQEVTPKGIDPRMWRQAIADNPDPKKFIPVPLVGFNELKWRITCQENETGTHMSYLAKLEKDIGELKQRHANTSSKIMEQRRKFAELSHRILRIIVKQESTRKVGLALTPDEEIIKTKLENMHALVSAPTQFKGKLSELLSQMRMQRSQWASTGVGEYTLDKESSDEMKNFLTMQQKAMELLIETVNKDLKDLKIISDGMLQQFGTNVN